MRTHSTNASDRLPPAERAGERASARDLPDGNSARHPLVAVAKRAFRAFSAHDTLELAAALAFYTALSLAPLIIVLLWLLGQLRAGSEAHLLAQVEQLIGVQGREVTQAVIDSTTRKPGVASVAGIVSLGTFAFGASGVFSQLQHSLNTIWNVEAKPGLGVRAWLRKRLLSFSMLGLAAFLLLVSLVASAAVAAIAQWAPEGVLLQTATLVVSTLVYAALFGAVFKLLPDVRMAWRDVVLGALLTAVLFTVGKTFIGLYVAHYSVGSSYGAAGSLVVVLVWVYFSSAIVLFGAELTEAWAFVHGRAFQPNK